MKVKDMQTGNILESDNDIVTGGWKNNPKRYVVEAPEGTNEEGAGNIPDLVNMTVEELQAFAEANGIDIGNATSHAGILKKIAEAQKE